MQTEIIKTPAFQWYPKDILSSARVAQMTLEEECAYRRAIDYCWLNGSIPADAEKCARMIGKGCSSEVATVVQEMFIIDPNDPSKLLHDRLEEERAKQEAWRKKSSEGGKKSAEARRAKAQNPPQAPPAPASNANSDVPETTGNQSKGGSSVVQPPYQPNANSSSSSSSSSSFLEKNKNAGARDGGVSFDSGEIQNLGLVDLDFGAEVTKTLDWVRQKLNLEFLYDSGKWEHLLIRLDKEKIDLEEFRIYFEWCERQSWCTNVSLEILQKDMTISSFKNRAQIAQKTKQREENGAKRNANGKNIPDTASQSDEAEPLF